MNWASIPGGARLQRAWRRQHLSKRFIDLGAAMYDRDRHRLVSYQTVRPNLVLIGAQKAGTTSLAHYLSWSPSIHVSSPMKEPGFFIFEEWARKYWASRGRDYSSVRELLRHGMLHGYQGERWFCDASTYYTTASRAEDYRIGETLAAAGAKVLYSVRNPFARMISNYNHVRDRVSESFNELLVLDSSLLVTSLYHRQLSSILEFVPREDVEVIVFEEFVADPQATLDRIAGFLDVERIVPSSGFPVRNKTEGKIDHQFSEENFERLSLAVRDDVAAFEQLLGRPLPWDLSAERWVARSAQ